MSRDGVLGHCPVERRRIPLIPRPSRVVAALIGIHHGFTVVNAVDPNGGLYLSNFNEGGRLSARPEGPTLEARRAEIETGVLGEGPARWRGSEPPPHQLGGLGERCKLPQLGPGRMVELG